MRAIKFRAWLKSEKRMYPVRTLYLSGYAGLKKQVELEGKLVAWAYTIDEDIDLMQFTGLCDKNGREIYEGDIVKRYDTFGTVQFGQGFSVDGALANTPGFGFCSDGESLECLWERECLEVIGNIYEGLHQNEDRGR